MGGVKVALCKKSLKTKEVEIFNVLYVSRQDHLWFCKNLIFQL